MWPRSVVGLQRAATRCTNRAGPTVISRRESTTSLPGRWMSARTKAPTPRTAGIAGGRDSQRRIEAAAEGATPSARAVMIGPYLASLQANAARVDGSDNAPREWRLLSSGPLLHP